MEIATLAANPHALIKKIVVCSDCAEAAEAAAGDVTRGYNGVGRTIANNDITGVHGCSPISVRPSVDTCSVPGADVGSCECHSVNNFYVRPKRSASAGVDLVERSIYSNVPESI